MITNTTESHIESQLLASAVATALFFAAYGSYNVLDVRG